MNRRSLFAIFLAVPAALIAAMKYPKPPEAFLMASVERPGGWKIVSGEIKGRRFDWLVRKDAEYLGGLTCEEYVLKEMQNRT